VTPAQILAAHAQKARKKVLCPCSSHALHRCGFFLSRGMILTSAG
jgi:hypothetical protein